MSGQTLHVALACPPCAADPWQDQSVFIDSDESDADDEQGFASE